MRLIPGKTKVRIELFKGVGIGDFIVAAIAAFLVIFLITSSIPYKWIIAGVIAAIAVILLVRIDEEPFYVFFFHILKHYAYKRKYERIYSDELLYASQDEDYVDVAVSKLFGKGKKNSKKSPVSADIEENTTKLSKKEQKQLDKQKEIERKEREKARKEEDKLLKSKKVADDVKEEIRQRRREEYAISAMKIADAKDANISRHPMTEIIGFTGIRDDFIEYGTDYYGAAIEIPPIEFRFLSELRRNNAVENGVGRVLRSLSSDFPANIVKIDRPFIYDEYLENERKKLQQLKVSYMNGTIREDEFQSRTEVMLDRLNDIEKLCTEDKVVVPMYYIVLFGSDKRQLNNQVNVAMDSMRSGELNPKRLNSKELAVFLRYTNEIDFDEHDIDKVNPDSYAVWAMPKTVDITPRTAQVNHIITHNLRVSGYPAIVGNAWMAGMMSIPGTKVVIKCSPMDRNKAIRGIDRSLQELRGQFSATSVDSRRIELQQHMETLGVLLTMLQGDNEVLLDVNIYVTAYDINKTRQTTSMKQPPRSVRTSVSSMKRALKRFYSENGVRLNGMDFDQVNAYIASQVSAYDPFKKDGRGIPSNTMAAAFPWVFAHISDKNGIKLGAADGVPVFIDFFTRDSERVNSNMVIVGKSGSGKSYATKSLLTNLAAENAKIFILDPENEYSELATNLHGKFINVGNAQYGRLNPFQIITALDDDETDGSSVSGSYATHLQFLEEFFRQILPECEKDAMEYLNSLIDRMYTNMGITSETNLSLLTPEDYPIFDDLYDAILKEFQSTSNQYIRTMLRTLMNYISKFSTGGRNANIWNGPSTVTTEENFTVFNFQSLLSNRNGMIANAQMLLVLKYIDNEIIKNREYNLRYHESRKIVVVIDEAHVFIDTKFPVALDFMFQLAKRIRKYNGMQIVITQNIKDFVGSEEIARKSSAIINACQYSFIFSLAPNDIQDLCKLYEKAGGINENEQDQILSAPRGQAFTIMSPQKRSSFKVVVPDNVRSMFEEPNHISKYFADEEGQAQWEQFVEGRHYLAASEETAMQDETTEVVQTDKPKKGIIFEEISEEEYETNQNAEKVELPKTKSISIEEIDDFDFDDIPEIPDDPAAFAAMKKDTKAATEPVSQMPATPVIVQAPAVSPEFEKMMASLTEMVGNIGKLSYDNIMDSVRQMMDEKVSAAPAATAISPVEMTEEAFAVEPATEEADSDDISSILGSIFNEDALAESARMDAEQAEEANDDIQSLLFAAINSYSDVSAIDLMKTYGDDVIELSLDELKEHIVHHANE